MEQSKCVIEGEPTQTLVRINGGMRRLTRAAPIKASETVTVALAANDEPERILEPSEESIIDRLRRAWEFRDVATFEACVRELEAK